MKKMATTKLALLSIAGAVGLLAQLPAPGGTPAAQDPLDRTSPQSSILRFLEAAHSRDYARAAYYLDLHELSPLNRSKSGPELARQLEDLLDDTPFDIATLSRDPEGEQSDGLGSAYEHLDTFRVEGETLDLQLQRVTLKNGLRVWLVSAPSVAMIPRAHTILGESVFEKHLPQELVTFEVLDTPVWRWIALAATGFGLWFGAGLFAWIILHMVRSIRGTEAFRMPLRMCLATSAFRVVITFIPPSSLARLFIERCAELAFVLAAAWGLAVVVDFVADRWRSRLDPRLQAVSYSVLPLGRQVLKLSLYLIALLGMLSRWGYNTSTILAGLGVGGLAVALAAQKTIENLFGGVSVIGDRPVLVGDVCRFGDRVGTVMHIGLRSTRLRTPERTIISVPNGQFSSMALENISGRDKIWFHPTLNLRRDTTSKQMTKVLESFREILTAEPTVESGKVPVRFVSVGQYSLDVEIAVYVRTNDYDEFLAVQQKLLLQMLLAVEQAGTALAVPLQETFESGKVGS